jgi:predicted hydrocarbon binding protein
MLSYSRWIAAAAMASISATGLAAETTFKVAGEACGFRILPNALRFRDLVNENNYEAASKLFLDNQSIGVARILTRNEVVSLEDQSRGMACVRRTGEPFCYWMSTEDFDVLVGHPQQSR